MTLHLRKEDNVDAKTPPLKFKRKEVSLDSSFNPLTEREREKREERGKREERKERREEREKRERGKREERERKRTWTTFG